MGFSPQHVRAMSVWQLFAAAEGYRAAHAPGRGGLSDEETDELWAWLDAAPRASEVLSTVVYGWDGGPVPLRRVTFGS